jgi:pimeloyl-ACP methyl ester carboxylesterase
MRGGPAAGSVAGMLEAPLDTPRQTLLGYLPATERRIDVAGVQTAVLEAGEGSPLILLHGPAANATQWMHVIPHLSGRYRVVAPDLPGHGRSDSADDAVAWLAALIAATCAEPPVIVGHALGGAIAARFALAHAEQVRRLVLVGTLGLAPFAPEPALGRAVHGFLTEPTPESHEHLWGACAFDLAALRGRMGDAWDAFAAYNVDRAATPSVAAAIGGMLERYAATPIDGLDDMRVPVALVWGRQDPAASLTIAAAASERHGWPLHVLEACGADPHLEQPEALVRALEAEALRTRLDGSLLLPGGPGFADATRLWNGMIATSPALVVQPEGPADVAGALAFAREHGVPVSVRGGGHNIAGTALCAGGVMIDFSTHKEVEVDAGSGRAKVQPGATWADVDRATQAFGLVVPGGIVSATGVAGFTLGGGFGWVTRR